MNENVQYLLECLETDLVDLRKMIEDGDDRVIILTLIREHMIKQLEEITTEL